MSLTNWFQLFLIIFSAWAGIAFARYLFKSRFNPLSLYTAVWAICLCLYEVRLVRYYPISLPAWAAIIGAWVFLYFGAIVALALRRKSKDSAPINIKRLKRALVFLSLISAVAVFDQIRVITSVFGNAFTAIYFNANAIYVARISNEWSALPYVSSCLFAACPLAGVYTAIRGKFTVLGIAPVILVVLTSIFSMSRGVAVLALLLYVVCFIYAPKKQAFNRAHRRAATVLTVAFMLAGFTFVSLTRGLVSGFDGETEELQALDDITPAISSSYSFISGPPVVLSRYFASREPQQAWFGMYTFAPVYRIFARFGIGEGVPPYEEDYETPIPMNVGTWLKNIYSDFGAPGIIAVPFFVGVFAAIFYGRRDIVGLVANAFIYSVLAFSVLTSLTVMGDWYIGLFVGLLSSAWIQRRPWPRLVHVRTQSPKTQTHRSV